jgi:hypothetical protein
MARAVGDTLGRGQRVQGRRGRLDILPTAPSLEPLSPTKQRIAQALAALLVAHYRRQQERAERERVPGA